MFGGRSGTARRAATVASFGFGATLLFLASTANQYGYFTFGLAPGMYLATFRPAAGALVSGLAYFSAELLRGVGPNPNDSLLWALALAGLTAAFGVLAGRCAGSCLPLGMTVVIVTTSLVASGTMIGPSVGAFGHHTFSDFLIAAASTAFAAVAYRKRLIPDGMARWA